MRLREVVLRDGVVVLRRIAEFLFLWGIAVTAAIFLGQTKVAEVPNAIWFGIYAIGASMLGDVIIKHLESDYVSDH